MMPGAASRKAAIPIELHIKATEPDEHRRVHSA